MARRKQQPKAEEAKAEETKAEETKAEETKAEETKAEETLVKQVKVTSKLYMANPYTKQRFFKGESAEVVLDSWAQGQIDVGLLVVE